MRAGTKKRLLLAGVAVTFFAVLSTALFGASFVVPGGDAPDQSKRLGQPNIELPPVVSGAEGDISAAPDNSQRQQPAVVPAGGYSADFEAAWRLLPQSSPLVIKQFVLDPSLSTRCPEASRPLEAMPTCPSLAATDGAYRDARRALSASLSDHRPQPFSLVPGEALAVAVGPEARPPLRVAQTSGATTATMKLLPAPAGTSHHPIYAVYAPRTVSVTRMLPLGPAEGAGSGVVGANVSADVAGVDYRRLAASRVVEFVGVHTQYDLDCVPDIDFRQYHQVRAALCMEHEGHMAAAASASSSARYVGMTPIVDEEYMEYAATLMAAHDAAAAGRRFTYVELGARYGTWAARAGAAYRLFYNGAEGAGTGGAPLSIPPEKLRLLAVEGSCHWYRVMEEHFRCNGLGPYATPLLAYAAPPSYNKVNPAAPGTYRSPRAVSLAQVVGHYEAMDAAEGGAANTNTNNPRPAIDLIDFDIQGFESIALEGEATALDALTRSVAFLHFGTHGTDVEATLLRLLQPKGWCVVYFFAGAHTKKLHKGHRCNTPFGSAVFNDGVMGLANMRFYRSAFGGSVDGTTAPQCPAQVPHRSRRQVGATCYAAPQASVILRQG